MEKDWQAGKLMWDLSELSHLASPPETPAPSGWYMARHPLWACQKAKPDWEEKVVALFC